MRLLHVIPHTDRRAPQVFARDLADVLHNLGHEVTVLALQAGQQRPGVEAEILSDKGRGVTATWGLRNRMREFDVTVAHGPLAGEACVRAGSKATKVVYRQVKDSRFWRRRPARPSSAPTYFTKAAAVVAMSPGARSDLIDQFNLPENLVRSIPPGIRSEPFSVALEAERVLARVHFELTDHKFVALTVGALTAERAVDVAVRAVVELDGVHLLVVGDGPERERLERLAEGLAPGKVTFAGELDDVRPAYAAADLMVHPSISGDSMPRVLIEAGLSGLASIATPVGSIEHIVTHGRTGMILPAGHTGGLGSAIELLSIDQAERGRMGVAARERCLNTFDIDIVAKEWIDLLQSVAG